MANNCKYYKQQRQVSYDEGETWMNVVPEEYQMGDLIGESSDCIDTSLTRWELVPGDYICVGKDKYEKEVGQYSNDNGVTWNNMYPTTFREGRLIESNSTVCNNKWEGHYYTPDSVRCGSGYTYIYGVGCVRKSSGGGGGDGTGGGLYFKYRDPIKFVRCDQSTSTTLTYSDITYNPYNLLYGIIGECVDEINVTFTGNTNLESMTLLPETPPILNYNNTFEGDYPIYVPCDSLSTYKAYWAAYADRIQAAPPCETPPPVVQYKLQATYGDGTTDAALCTGYSVVNKDDVKSGSSIVTAVIGDCVNSISAYGFSYCSSLTSMTIGSRIEIIDGYAMMGCDKLQTLNIPDSVTSIGFNCFGGCLALDNMTIGSGVTGIGYAAFYNCTGLTSITIYAPTPPEFTGGTQYDPFTNCYSLSVIYVPAGSVSLYRNSTWWVGRNILPIGEDFKLSSYYWDNVTNDSGANLVSCNTSTTLSATEARTGFWIDKKYMRGAIVGNCVTKLGPSCFAYCSSLAKVKLHNGITELDSHSFSNCTSLTDVILPSGITIINQALFYNCTSLRNIEIPSGVTEFDNYAFSGCVNLQSITVLAPTPPTLGVNVFDGDNNLTVIYVPATSVNTYKAASGWSNYTSIIQPIT